MHWSSLTSGFLFLNCIANYPVLNEIGIKRLAWKILNLRDDRDGCAVGAPFPVLPCTRRLIT